MSSDRYHRDRLVSTERAARLALQPAREYLIPGGPLARDLGAVDVAKLAEIERGSSRDVVR